MSQYQTTPFKQPPALAVAGTPQYLLGSWNDRTGPTLGYVISDSGNGTTSTVVFQIASGNVPVVGALVSIVGTANSSGGYNVTNVAIATVVTTEQGTCTITFLNTATSASAQDAGAVQVPQPEIGESVTSTYSSVPVAVPFNNPEMQEGKSITASVNLITGGTLSGVTAVLQGANIDLDGEYQTIHTFTATGASGNIYYFQSGQDDIAPSATPGAIEANPGGVNILNFRFYRFKISGGTGTGNVAAKFEI
jgi:hypothetical protein